MKKGILIVALSFFTFCGFSQAPLAKGSQQLNAGVGFSGSGIPIYLGMDFGVHPDISVGGELSFRTYSTSDVGVRNVYSVFGVSANGNYHFNTLLEIPSNFDFYAGLSLGMYFWNSSGSTVGNSSGIGGGVQVGGRYFFSRNMALNLELTGGYSISGGKFGITFLF